MLVPQCSRNCTMLSKKSKILKEKQWRKQVVIVTNKENRKKILIKIIKTGLQEQRRKQIYIKFNNRQWGLVCPIIAGMKLPEEILSTFGKCPHSPQQNSVFHLGWNLRLSITQLYSKIIHSFSKGWTAKEEIKRISRRRESHGNGPGDSRYCQWQKAFPDISLASNTFPSSVLLHYPKTYQSSSTLSFFLILAIFCIKY